MQNLDWVVPGIPDEMFERVEKIPMTKEEIRPSRSQRPGSGVAGRSWI